METWKFGVTALRREVKRTSRKDSIGAAWPSKSGKGFNITWEYLPLGDGVTVMLPYDQRHDDIQIVPDEQPA